jgi:hypothetical protein
MGEIGSRVIDYRAKVSSFRLLVETLVESPGKHQVFQLPLFFTLHVCTYIYIYRKRRLGRTVPDWLQPRQL